MIKTYRFGDGSTSRHKSLLGAVKAGLRKRESWMRVVEVRRGGRLFSLWAGSEKKNLRQICLWQFSEEELLERYRKDLEIEVLP